MPLKAEIVVVSTPTIYEIFLLKKKVIIFHFVDLNCHSLVEHIWIEVCAYLHMYLFKKENI